MAFRPQTKYTDRAAAACPRSHCKLLQVEGATRSVLRIPTTVDLGSVDVTTDFYSPLCVSHVHNL
jgi:hypothetical protein